MNAIQKKRGLYLGTKINHHWWRRYTEGEFSARGIGEYWIENGSLFFQHRARQKPIKLPLRNLTEIELCPCRKSVGGIPIIKLIWHINGDWLTSTFAIFGSKKDTSQLLTNLRTQTI